ncbi:MULTISPECIES: hypothetical protein [Streptomyces]|uniref:hypothetical protein n=1 Tax=Streptomyces TaxID=1883 RepID=UPI000F7A8EB0|nr:MULTISPECIES: hypothetical protein [Streptomyces]RST08805.1 hypothetical protein EF910_00775 [Streptomyces sp. WAC07149]GLX19736.1 hypothetical protein Slala01_33800 [Streptomyces lavendulae subsp. lavendulae]GLX27231.1 hypothetical protein Slala02_30510 [Streptomyces lavendulae subsp. lavendulae]
MPGQRKRKRGRQDEARRTAARFAPGAGRWDVLFETQDASEFQDRVRRLRESDPEIDWSAVRGDTFCGRLIHPTTYRLSLFVPEPLPAAGQAPAVEG